MNTAPNSITGRGYVLAAYGNPAGDMNPTYDIVLATPPDLAGKKFFAVANDNRLAVNAKVRPAAYLCTNSNNIPGRPAADAVARSWPSRKTV